MANTPATIAGAAITRFHPSRHALIGINSQLPNSNPTSPRTLKRALYESPRTLKHALYESPRTLKHALYELA
jgi:hypothetical protein